MLDQEERRLARAAPLSITPQSVSQHYSKERKTAFFKFSVAFFRRSSFFDTSP
jgi:hypothetical protein